MSERFDKILTKVYAVWDELTAKRQLLIVVGLFLILLLSLCTRAEAQVSSVRSSQYDWSCTTADGVHVSGHTRQDKAFQSCINEAVRTGQSFTVKGGTYRIEVSIAGAPPPDPDPDPDPPPPDPVEQPQVTFGPVTSITQYPNTISALAQDAVRWQLTFTLNTVAGIQGLASRDENGTTDPGHLSIWVDNGQLIVRHQGSNQSVEIAATTAIVANVEYVATVSVEAGVGIGIHLGGVLEASAPDAWGLAGNDLPLFVGGLCSRCNNPNDPTQGPDRPIDGSVHLAIYDDPLALPQPVAVMLNWTNPTEDENNDPLPTGIPDRISIYGVPGPESAAVPRGLVAHLDGEAIAYEVIGLSPGQYCFVATAWHIPAESVDSNRVCKVAQ